MMEGMRELQQQGIVKHIGMAVRENAPLLEFMEQPECDVIQIVDDYCLIRRYADDSGVLAKAAEKDIGVVQAAPMYRGMLYTNMRKGDVGNGRVGKCPEVGELISTMADWSTCRGHQLPDLAVQVSRPCHVPATVALSQTLALGTKTACLLHRPGS